MRNWWLCICLIGSFSLQAQFEFGGYADPNRWQNEVFLSLVEDYRKSNGLYSEQLIAKAAIDSSGKFVFNGNYLDSENRIYRLHVDNCEAQMGGNHFNGDCGDSRDILFIAKNTDSISFPETFADQMFCEINANSEVANSLMRVDSLKEAMKFAFQDNLSASNHRLFNKKWFGIFQDFGRKLNEPLANLYIYKYLSDRENGFYQYYLSDLESNDYYDQLALALKDKYMESTYYEQYLTELNADKFSITPQENQIFQNYWLYALLALSLLFNVFLFFRKRNSNYPSSQPLISKLTKQEKIIFDLLLQDKSNKEIAEIQFISLSTVKTHLNNIYRKLGVQNRSEAKELDIK